MIKKWSSLQEKDKDIIDLVLTDWENLLGNAKAKEREYHEFLRENACLFMGSPYDAYFVLSKLKLGSEYETDFVTIRENYSHGFSYILTEIQSPHSKLFNKNGTYSKELNEALNQVSDWKRWMKENRETARRILPYKWMNMGGGARFSFRIVIGRRDDHEENTEKRNELCEQFGVEIRSFDYFTDRLKNQVFTDKALISSAETNEWSHDKRSDLANPFASAIGDGDWKEVLKRKRKLGAHITYLIFDDIKEIRNYSRYHEKYLKRYPTDDIIRASLTSKVKIK